MCSFFVQAHLHDPKPEHQLKHTRNLRQIEYTQCLCICVCVFVCGTRRKILRALVFSRSICDSRRMYREALSRIVLCSLVTRAETNAEDFVFRNIETWISVCSAIFISLWLHAPSMLESFFLPLRFLSSCSCSHTHTHAHTH